MTRMLLLMLASLLGLAGCAQTGHRDDKSAPSEGGFDARWAPVPRPTAPFVYVVDGYLVVNQEPIRLWRRHYNQTDKKVWVSIHWQLPAFTSYTWSTTPSSAISFKPEPPGLQCLTASKLLSCTFNYEPKAEYKYTLTALDNGKPLPALDPYIFNME